jgi:predicted small lipoprotein YifL
MLQRAASILVLVAAAGLAACGQKGPLYVPGVPQNAPWPYPDPPRKAPRGPAPVPDLPGTTDERK